MKKILKTTKFMFMSCIIAVSSVSFAANTVKALPNSMDAVLASVNGVPIILSDVVFEAEQSEMLIASSLEQEKAKEIILEMRRRLVDEIIDRKLIIEAYHKNPFPIADEYVNSFMDEMAKESGLQSRKEFYKNLRQANVDINQFREKIRERVIVQFSMSRLLYNQVNISPKKIYDYYQAHKDSEFTTPDKVGLSLIFVSKNNSDYQERKSVIEKALATSANEFPYLASTYSDLEKSKKNNGELGFFAISEMRDEFKEFANQRKLGIVSPPIELEDGTYYLMLNELELGKVTPLQDVELELKKQLEAKERERLYKEYVEKLRKNAIIEYFF